jgi:hypothetical protein
MTSRRHLISRRGLLGGASALGLALFGSSRARADLLPGGLPAPSTVHVGSRIARTVTDARGIGGRWPPYTKYADAEHRLCREAVRGGVNCAGGAPPPPPGAPPPATVSTVVHFHGHNSTAERAMGAHQLREQLYESKQNAILVVPQLAVNAPDSSGGKLEAPGGFARMLADTLRTLDVAAVRTAAGPAALSPDASLGRVCVSAHSGGYHAAACALRHGGAPVHEAYLFDALYADVDVFRDWVIAGHGKPMGSRHKLVSYFTAGRTEANTLAMFAELERAGVVCAHEQIEGTLSREDLTRAEAVSIRTALAHGAVTSELNSLRDCLYASALRRNLRSSWFEAKHGARPLERRR